MTEKLDIFEDQTQADVFGELPTRSIYTKVNRKKVKNAYLNWINGEISEQDFSDILDNSII